MVKTATERSWYFFCILKNKKVLGRAWDGVHTGRQEIKVGEFSTPLQCDKFQRSGVRSHLNEEKFYQVN